MKIKTALVLLKYYNGELNPFDQSALECAICTGAEVTVLTMAPPSVKEHIKSLTRLGVKAVLVTDEIYKGSDTLATSKVLYLAIKRINPDVVFCGRQSVDGDTSQVPPMTAKRLNFNFVNKVIEFDGENYRTRDGKTGSIKYKTVYTFERIKSLRFPSIFSKEKEVSVLTNEDLNVNENEVGESGSPTSVLKTYRSDTGRRKCKFIDFADLEKIVFDSLNKKTENPKEIFSKSELLKKVFYLGNIKNKAESISEKAIPIEYKGKTAEDIVKTLKEQNAETVLFSDDENLKILASEIAVLTNSGLTADCVDLKVKNGILLMTRPAFGGDITADIVCKSKMALSTLRTEKQVGDVIFAVGNGAIHRLEDIKILAKKFNAIICSSRAVADSGKMPYETQVGLTGKSVSPKVYVAFGISGAVQHTCAISGAKTVIAVNRNKDERIFDYADYGIIKEL